MAALPSALGYTPHCGSCGVALCWDISEEEYAEMKEFWDEWKCDMCNPDANGAWLRFRIEHNIPRHRDLTFRRSNEDSEDSL